MVQWEPMLVRIILGFAAHLSIDMLWAVSASSSSYRPPLAPPHTHGPVSVGLEIVLLCARLILVSTQTRSRPPLTFSSPFSSTSFGHPLWPNKKRESVSSSSPYSSAPPSSTHCSLLLSCRLSRLPAGRTIKSSLEASYLEFFTQP